MRGFLTFAAAFALATPTLGQEPVETPMRPSPQTQVENAVDRFFAALKEGDNEALAQIMMPEGMIMVDDRTNPDKPNLVILPNALYVQSSAKRDKPFDELMEISSIMIHGGVAQVWGPYRVLVDGETTHCGVNSMTFIETEEDLWRLGNTSFTMVAPQDCGSVDAPKAP